VPVVGSSTATLWRCVSEAIGLALLNLFGHAPAPYVCGVTPYAAASGESVWMPLIEKNIRAAWTSVPAKRLKTRHASLHAPAGREMPACTLQPMAAEAGHPRLTFSDVCEIFRDIPIFRRHENAAGQHNVAKDLYDAGGCACCDEGTAQGWYCLAR